MLCCGYTLTDFPISIRLTSLALWQSNDCPSASKATLMNMDKYFMWIHYERLHNHNKAKHNKTVCIFLGIYCICRSRVIISMPSNEHVSEVKRPQVKRQLSHFSAINTLVRPRVSMESIDNAQVAVNKWREIDENGSDWVCYEFNQVHIFLRNKVRFNGNYYHIVWKLKQQHWY